MGVKPFTTFTTRGFILAYLYRNSAAFDDLLRAFHAARQKGIVLGTEEELLADLRWHKAGGWIRENPDGTYTAPPEVLSPEDREALEEESRMLRAALGT